MSWQYYNVYLGIGINLTISTFVCLVSFFKKKSLEMIFFIFITLLD
eukprot:UN00741